MSEKCGVADRRRWWWAGRGAFEMQEQRCERECGPLIKHYSAVINMLPCQTQSHWAEPRQRHPTLRPRSACFLFIPPVLTGIIVPSVSDPNCTTTKGGKRKVANQLHANTAAEHRVKVGGGVTAPSDSTLIPRWPPHLFQ